MILTLYYMYATIIQWWRLGSLKNKLNGTLNAKNALLLSTSKSIHNSKRQRTIENLLFHLEDRLACTILPKQHINLSHWILFPKDPRNFPIFIEYGKCILKPPHLYVIIRTILENYTKHKCELIQIENFGELVAWKAASKFEIVLKTDLDNLTKLVHCFSNSSIDINHDLEMLEMETVNIDGNANRIKYERKYSLEETVRYSHSQVHWRKFAGEVKNLYLKIRENSNPKIKIENGAGKSDDFTRKVPVYEAKPIKKETRKLMEDKNTLDVSGSKRHKSPSDKKEKLPEEKQKTDRKSKEDSPKIKEPKTESTKTKLKTSNKQEITRVSEPDSSSKNTKANTIEKPINAVADGKSKESKTKEIESITTKTKEIRKEKSKEHNTISSDRTANKDKKIAKDAKDDKDNKQGTSKYKEVVINAKDIEKSNKTKDKKMMKNDESRIEASSISTNCDKIEDESSSKIKNSRSNINVNVKPPNILVYADSLTAKENVKAVLSSVINIEKYIIYDFPSNISSNPAWSDSTQLVVICGATTPDLTFQLLQYLVKGGQLLCLCSDLLHSILNVFSTAEVREHELVRFSYGEWKRVKMMHHIFCYQASPAKKQFSKDSVESNHNSNGSSPIAPRTPSSTEILHNGKNYTLQVQVLGTEETWQTPSLLLATLKNSTGRAVFSQVHLEIDPLQYEDDENKFTALKDSNQARLEILTDILKNRLNIDCIQNIGPVNYTPAYFLGRHDMKMEMFKECKDIVDNKLDCDKVSLVFCGKNVDPGLATATRLPVMLYSCPSTFSTVEYFSILSTEYIGRLVIYADVLKSSQYILSRTIKHGLVVIPRQQSGAIGRSNNVWLSPIGCACFSLQLHIPLSSPLGRMLSIVQQLIIVAIVEALKKNPGFENLDLGIKWPNDIYIDRSVKFGGLIVNSNVGNKMAVLNIGCGLNLDNTEPTLCLNEHISNYNKENKTALEKLSQEKYFASIFNEIEDLYDIIQNDNVDKFYDLYYKHWIHKDAKVTIVTEECESQKATVVGIDDFGFLKVKLENGEISVVHPDGNSFDMLKGLIIPKPSYRTQK